MRIFGYTFAQIVKAVFTAAGFVVAFLTAVTPFVPERYVPWVIGVIGVATTVSVFIAKNAPAAAPPVGSYARGVNGTAAAPRVGNSATGVNGGEAQDPVSPVTPPAVV